MLFFVDLHTYLIRMLSCVPAQGYSLKYSKVLGLADKSADAFVCRMYYQIVLGLYD